jgi:hypothetical protein
MQLDSYIQMKRNGMQIGGNGIENLLVTIALNFWGKKRKRNRNSKRHISIPLYLRIG